jgi:AbrB family looped-hinge helix DNA binding protein
MKGNVMGAKHQIKVESNGRILLPAAIRKEMGLNPGDSLVVYYNTELHIVPLKNKIKECQQLVKKYNKKNISLVDSLKNSRKQDNE